jgi:hypothetical protein
VERRDCWLCPSHVFFLGAAELSYGHEIPPRGRKGGTEPGVAGQFQQD